MLDIEVYFERYCKEHNLEIALSREMPEGYETAFGSFDPTRRTLFLNMSMLRTAPEERRCFISIMNFAMPFNIFARSYLTSRSKQASFMSSCITGYVASR